MLKSFTRYFLTSEIDFNKVPEALVLLRSLFIDVVNFSEKVSPVFTPENLMDRKPLMSSIK